MAKSFRQYMAETGRQSELDILGRTPGGYEKAEAEYRSRGAYGAAPGGGAGSPVDIAKQMYEMSSQFRQPAIETLQARQPGIAEAYGGLRTAAEAEKEPLTQRYENLLADITKTTRGAASEEFTRRGIPLSSGLVEKTVGERMAPQIERVGLERETGLRDINQLIANLGMKEQGQYDLLANAISAIQAAASPEAIGAAQGIYGQQQQAQQEAARLALAQLTQQQQAAYQQQQLGFQQQQAAWEKPWQERLWEYELGKPYYKPSQTYSTGLEDLYSQVFG